MYGGRRVVPCGKTDARRDMKLIVAFQNFTKTPENLFYCRNMQCIVITTDGVSVVFNESYQRPRFTVMNDRMMKRNR
jgi:hypothetical protein